ncbi:MAG: hypothetical protein WCL13_04095, partial [bacterium]
MKKVNKKNQALPVSVYNYKRLGFLSLRELSRVKNFSEIFLEKLVIDGRLKAFMIDRYWYTTNSWFEEYLINLRNIAYLEIEKSKKIRSSSRVNLILEKTNRPVVFLGQLNFIFLPLSIIYFLLLFCLAYSFIVDSDIKIEKKNLFIVNVKLKLRRGKTDEIKDLTKENSRKRKLTNPKQPSAGCVFKNLTYEKLAKQNLELAENLSAKGLFRG